MRKVYLVAIGIVIIIGIGTLLFNTNSEEFMDFCENKETEEYVYKYNDLVSNKFKYNWGFDYMIYDGRFLYV